MFSVRFIIWIMTTVYFPVIAEIYLFVSFCQVAKTVLTEISGFVFKLMTWKTRPTWGMVGTEVIIYYNCILLYISPLKTECRMMCVWRLWRHSPFYFQIWINPWLDNKPAIMKQPVVGVFWETTACFHNNNYFSVEKMLNVWYLRMMKWNKMHLPDVDWLSATGKKSSLSQLWQPLIGLDLLPNKPKLPHSK